MMNNPGKKLIKILIFIHSLQKEKFNAWGKSMTDQLKIHFEKAASNPDTKVSLPFTIQDKFTYI